MNKEIEEIINDLQRVADRKCYPEDILCGSIAQEWVDYITDLQGENENLKADYGSKSQVERDLLEDRINKAIEYIETHQLNFKKGITTFGSERLSMEERKLLNILKGDE